MCMIKTHQRQQVDITIMSMKTLLCIKIIMLEGHILLSNYFQLRHTNWHIPIMMKSIPVGVYIEKLRVDSGNLGRLLSATFSHQVFIISQLTQHITIGIQSRILDLLQPLITRHS